MNSNAPKKPIRCWEFFKCLHSECPAYHAADCKCWLHPGSCCHNSHQKKDANKLEMCLACPVLQENMNTGDMGSTLDLVRHQFHTYQKEIDERDNATERFRQALETGLSDVIAALTKLATGDPSVRLTETSDLETVRQIKRLVNEAAENLSDIVDLSHEFAIGLAEHFDVLHRVSTGDLSARIQGSSPVELLESLKKVTNTTIESVAREIMEHRQTTINLKESETRFRTFIENAPIGISIRRPDMTFEYLNPTFTNILGYTIEDFPSKEDWFEKAYPDETYRAMVKNIWESDFQKHNGNERIKKRSFTVRCKDGKDKIISFQTVLLPDGRYLLTYSDITEKALSEATIKQSEEKYRTLVDNIKDGVFIQVDGIVEFVNDALARMIGCTTEEMIGRPITDFIVPEDHDRVMDHYKRRMRNEEVESEYTIRLRHKDNKTIVTVVIKAGIFSFHDRLAAIGTINDITERMRAEEEKKKLEKKLQRSQHLEAIGTLAGGVAHDLNNILSGIVSYPELLLVDLPYSSPLRKPIQIIQRSGEKAAAIVQDLLTLARRGVAVKRAVNLNQVITDFLKSHEFDHLKQRHSNITVDTDLAADLPNIHASPIHISKTVMNLLFNAAEAMPNGGEIIIKTDRRYVDQPIRGYDEVQVGNYTTLEISDNGVGICATDLDKIFEPFYTKKKMGRSGTGLGMAVVWGAVKDHQGHIDVKSGKDSGTTFTLFFPVTKEKPHPEIPQLSPKEYQGNGEKILVVDDMAAQREIAKAILTKLGYAVATVASGEEAIEYLKTHDADLLLLDMIMKPGIDGLETFRRVRENNPHQKAIVASGFSLSDRVEEIRKLGVAIYLKKPYSIENLGMALRSELER